MASLLGSILFRVPVRLFRMLEGLSGKFICAKVIPLAMGSSSSGVSVRGNIVEFCNTIVRTLCHVVLLVH